jgi:hypothetical protein
LPGQEIESKIIDYIKQNGGTTKNKVADYMSKKEISSYVTTLKAIDRLKSKNIVEDRKEGNSFHRLFINNKNDFNKIDEHLTKIENLLDEMREPVRRVVTIPYASRNYSRAVDFKIKYEAFFSTMLQALLWHTADRIHSERDSHVLFNRIVKLMLKLRDQFSNAPYFNVTLGSYHWHFEDEISLTVKKLGVKGKLIKDLKILREDLEQKVLS